MRYEHVLSEGHKAIATVTIDRLPKGVLAIRTVRETNQALQEVSEHRRELMPLVITPGGGRDCMETHKPIGKGA